MSEAAGRPSRRRVLAGAGLLALAGCVPGRDQGLRPPVDPEIRTRGRIAEEVRALARHYDAVMRRFPEADPRLATFAAEHDAHARALLGPSPGASSRGTPSPGTPSPTSVAPEVPAVLNAALQSLVEAEQAASRRRSRQAGRASPLLARLLASIAGCEAAHAALLSAPAGSP